MKRLQMIRANAALLLVIALLALAASTHAQSGGGYDLMWNTIDNGGGIGAGVGAPNTYILNDTIGQSDAATWQGGGYTLVGGFWVGEAAQYRIYLPLILGGT